MYDTHGDLLAYFSYDGFVSVIRTIVLEKGKNVRTK